MFVTPLEKVVAVTGIIGALGGAGVGCVKGAWRISRYFTDFLLQFQGLTNAVQGIDETTKEVKTDVRELTQSQLWVREKVVAHDEKFIAVDEKFEAYDKRIVRLEGYADTDDDMESNEIPIDPMRRAKRRFRA